MYAAGIDDGKVCVQIALLDENIRRAEAAWASTGPLEGEREKLLRLLADLALEEDAPLPGADAEYAAAREALTLLTYRDATP
jgi:hypothetical protein